MNRIREIIAKRAAPGVLILDREDTLLYSNQEALAMLSLLQEKDPAQPVPAEVYDLCRRLRSGMRGTAGVFGVISHPGPAREMHYSLRAFVLGNGADTETPGHVMVLMEKVIMNRQIDLDKAREKFQLSKRETEVVGLICQGLGNKEISNAIFISEFTVKDHVKNIMRKMAVASRNEIVAVLL